jgi:membrane protease YdiL (CAAX protease family)
MNKITDWIKRHQIAAFFIITFAITWGLGFSWGAVLQRNQGLLLPLAFVTPCGPGLAGIIISAVTNAQPIQGPRRAFWIAFLVAWVVSVLVCLANLTFIEHFPLSPMVVGIFTISVAPVAFVIASAYSRIPSVRSYLASLIRLRGVWGWALLALVLFPALHLISFPINSLLNRQPIPSNQFPDMSLALIGLVIVKFFYQLFFFNATGEETGWRGFALPRLQKRTSPLIAALVIAFFWVPWHLFGWKAEGQPVLTLQYWIVMYIGHILLSVLIVWIFNRAKGSILVAGFTHAATNTVQAFIPVQNILSLYLTLFVAVLVLILVDRMWKKLPPDHLAVYQTPGIDEKNVELSQL